MPCRSFPAACVAAEPILPPGGITAGQLLFAVPAGSPENLLQFMDKLRLKTSLRRGAGNFREEEGICNCGGGRPRRRRPARAGEVRKACSGKITAIKMLYRAGDPLVEQRLDDLPGELERAGQADLVRTVRYLLLGQRLRRTGALGLKAAQQHLAAVRLCLDGDGVDITASYVANEAAQAVLRAGDKEGRSQGPGRLRPALRQEWQSRGCRGPGSCSRRRPRCAARRLARTFRNWPPRNRRHMTLTLETLTMYLARVAPG